MRPALTAAVPAALVLLLVWSCGHQDGGGQPDRSLQATAPIDLSAARAIIERKNALFTAAHVAGDVATIDRSQGLPLMDRTGISFDILLQAPINRSSSFAARCTPSSQYYGQC